MDVILMAILEAITGWFTATGWASTFFTSLFTGWFT